MLEAKNLKKVYKIKNGAQVNALDGVSLKLPDTGMVFILGKSGSGKSTLLNVLGGLDSFDSGEIIIKGTSAKDFKQSHYDSYRNTYIGFIFQEYNVLEELTVGANIALAIELQGRRATNEEINAILKEVDLDGLGARKPNELSGGQKQRVAIARALVKKPEIIMADEPTGALDSVTGKQVFDTLKKLSSDKLVLIVSHDREFSEQYADRIIELKDGKIISDVEKTADADVLEQSTSPTDSITYGEGEITLKGGYSLTEEDRLAINEYLKAYADGAVIKVGRSGQKKYSSKDFAPTDESKIKSDKTGDFTLIKSRLSIKNAFKLGSGALKYKKVRLVITIFLSLISFTLFGVADTIAAYDNISTATNSIYDTGVNYASYTKLVKQVHGDYVYWKQDSNYLTPDEIELIGELTGRDIIGIYKKRNDDFSFDINLGNNMVEGMTPSVIYAASFSGITAIDEELIEEHGFSLLGDSRLPKKNKNEIVITKYVYDYFEKVGHTAFGDTGEVKTDIKSVADILGKKITFGLRYNDSTEYTVVGVVDTGFDITRYEPLAADDAEFNLSMIESMALMAELDAAQEYSFACVCFVHPALMEELIEKQSAEPEKIENSGSVEIFQVISDDVQNKYDLYSDDRSNVLTSFNFSALYSLENIKERVVWLGTPKTVLADNQIVLAERAIREIMSGGYYMLSDAHRLTGYEKTIYEKYKNGEIYCYSPTLFNHFQNPKYFAAFSYAYNNLEEAKAAYADYLGVDNVVEYFDNFSYEFYDAFSRAAASGRFNEIINDATAKKYVNDLATKYGLTSMLISDAVREAVVATCTYKGVEYYSYDTQRMYINTSVVNELDNILAYKYVFENFSDALSFAKLKYPESEHDNIDFWSAVSLYYDHIIYEAKAPDGFIPTATIDFESYKLAEIVKLYTLMRGENKLVIATYSDRTFAETLIKNVEVVGIFNDDGNYDRVSAIGVSEGIINSILGPNRGGIYSFAVGTMPADKSDIRELVKFTKTYESEDGSVKYNLSNNVTLQLDMVDEILNVLGKVFVYVGIGLAVFASLMLANFISTSITYKKQEIGILRAIGSRSRDVFQIFFAESFIIAMISYVLSVIGTFTVTTVVNNVLRNNVGMLITILNFSIREVGLLLLISLLVAFVATFFPVNKIASMKPIDAIKNRK